ncbi:hypothetical protein BCR32DRAFT_277799 [Anaeromyces robustus]|uniref:Uncharacterized protein n=1 Tax=Anaeromyces robustus TaxID=1754192 RepID=A0A1Y1XDA7_9FUNG|nr:hypothetical protein BCR32DRAFT_288203 [Anaeromyces robustus]ORX83719.1 hypothetical protein BCR32DRAFT_277799 [Anaeromyces robustus]|eukprot:ORX48328.1 hypothetical protein BCR32DRAFT_288203 [Anaeromyces robustus]
MKFNRALLLLSTLATIYCKETTTEKCVPLNGKEPAHNPYHSSLIQGREVEGNINEIVTFGPPFKPSKNSCGKVKGLGGSKITCKVEYSENHTTIFNEFIPDDRCYDLSYVLPINLSDVNVWECTTSDNEVYYKKNIVTKSMINKTLLLKECDQKLTEEPIIPNLNDFYYDYKPNKNTFLNTSKYLKPNQYITSLDKEYSFGLLSSGELVLCYGPKVDDKCERIWTNGMNYIPKVINNKKINYHFKLHLGENGHLYVTAKHIFADSPKDRKEYVIWDSLPKDLPYKVGYSDEESSYNLYIDNEEIDYPLVKVIDGAGVEILKINSDFKYEGYSFLEEYDRPLAFDIPKNKKKLN